jgi:DNA-binding NarL/FixJ family response regulator
MQKAKVFIADDHEMIRDGLKMLLSKNSDLKLVGEAGKGSEVLQKFTEVDADLLILDISMPDMNGMDVADKILSEQPDAKIIVLSMYNDEEYISRCIEHGVKGYVVKSEASSELLHAVNTVLKGGSYFSQQAQNVIFKKYTTNAIRKRKEADIKLTTREIEIVKLISQGLTSNGIAEKLFISPRTVDTHRANLMKKVGAKNSIELLKKMEKMGAL